MTTTTCTNEVHSRATTSRVSPATCNRVCSHTATNIRHYASHLPSLQPGRDQFASRHSATTATAIHRTSHLCQPNSQPPRDRPPFCQPPTIELTAIPTATNNNRRIASHFQPILNPRLVSYFVPTELAAMTGTVSISTATCNEVQHIRAETIYRRRTISYYPTRSPPSCCN